MVKGEIDAAADADLAIWMTRVRSNGAPVEIASNLTGGCANRACCVPGIRGKLLRDNPATVAALTRAVREGAQYVATNPDGSAQIFYEYTPKAVGRRTRRQCCAVTRICTVQTVPACGLRWPLPSPT